MRRATRSGLRRNAAIVLGNRGDEVAMGPLLEALGDEDPVVRGHVAWAIGRIDGKHPALTAALAREPDARVRAELAAALSR